MQKYMVNLIKIDGQRTCLHYKRESLTKCDEHNITLLRYIFFNNRQLVNIASNGKFTCALCLRARRVVAILIKLPLAHYPTKDFANASTVYRLFERLCGLVMSCVVLCH